MPSTDPSGQQLADRLAWVPGPEGVVMQRCPLGPRGLVPGTTLRVRDDELAALLRGPLMADVFGPGEHLMTRRQLPVLAALTAAEGGADGPWPVELLFFSTALQPDRPWGGAWTAGGRAYTVQGHYAYRLVDARRFRETLGLGRERCAVAELDAHLATLPLAHLAAAAAACGLPPAAIGDQKALLASRLRAETAPAFEALGLQLEAVSLSRLD